VSSQMERETYNLPDFFKMIGISRPVGYELAKRGALPVPVIHLGNRMVVSKRAVEDVLNAKCVPTRPAPSDEDNAVWDMVLKLAAINTYLVDRVTSLEHYLGHDDDKAEDMLDVLEELRAEIRALQIGRKS